jgi:anaerobic selenocysteine-containing dehydrogenase
MEDNSKKPNENSRREVLKLGAYGLGAIGAIALAGGANAQVKKATQTTVRYQATPKDGKTCTNCRHFAAPSSCNVVEGTVGANGYCIIWVKKA